MDVIIYHNPKCATSRNVLGLIRNAGVEPHVVDYQKCPPTTALLAQLLARAGLSVREILRKKGTPYDEPGLDDPALSDEALYAAIAAHPILMNRPLVVTPKGVRLCRPSEGGHRPPAAAARRILQGGRRADRRREGPARGDGVSLFLRLREKPARSAGRGALTPRCA